MNLLLDDQTGIDSDLPLVVSVAFFHLFIGLFRFFGYTHFYHWQLHVHVHYLVGFGFSTKFAYEGSTLDFALQSYERLCDEYMFFFGGGGAQMFMDKGVPLSVSIVGQKTCEVLDQLCSDV